MKGIGTLGALIIITIIAVILIISPAKLPFGSLTDGYGGTIRSSQIAGYSRIVDASATQGCQGLPRYWLVGITGVPSGQESNINQKNSYYIQTIPTGSDRGGVSVSPVGGISILDEQSGKVSEVQGMILSSSWGSGTPTLRNENERCAVSYHVEFCDPTEKYNVATQSCQAISSVIEPPGFSPPSMPICSQYQIYNPDMNTCENQNAAIGCPSGQIYSDAAKQCIDEQVPAARQDLLSQIGKVFTDFFTWLQNLFKK